MELPKVKYISHTPLWKMQKQDDEYLPLTLPVALFGMLNALFYIIISLTAWLGHGLVDVFDLSPTLLNLILENLFLLVPISFLSSMFILFLFYLFSETFSDYNLITEFNHQVGILAETIEIDSDQQVSSLKSSRSLILRDLSLVYFYGFLTGIFYSLIYAIPYLFLYIFFTLVIINFTTFSITLTTSMLLSWVLLSSYIVRQKLIVEEIVVRNLDPHAVYGFTDRTVEIIASNEPPVICSGCRSYIAATSKICNVCGDPIDYTNS